MPLNMATDASTATIRLASPPLGFALYSCACLMSIPLILCNHTSHDAQPLFMPGFATSSTCPNNPDSASTLETRGKGAANAYTLSAGKSGIAQSMEIAELQHKSPAKSTRRHRKETMG